MKITSHGIAEGGEARLREAIKRQVREKHAAELASAQNTSRRLEIELKIAGEINEKLKDVASPYSLWSSV